MAFRQKKNGQAMFLFLLNSPLGCEILTAMKKSEVNRCYNTELRS